MEFGLSGASRCRPARELVVDQLRAGLRQGSNYLDMSETRSATSSRAGLRPGSGLLASWIAPDRPNSITLSSSLAGRRQAREPARELDIVMEFGPVIVLHCDANI